MGQQLTVIEDPSMPVVDSWYEARGYIFRVDFVEGGEAYYVRWPINSPPGEYGYPGRISVEDWAAAMKRADVKMVPAPKVGEAL